MKYKSFLAIVLLALVGALAVPQIRAEEPTKEKKVSKKDLAKYDADKNGELSAEERAVMTADKEKAKADRKEKKKHPAEAEPEPKPEQ